MMTAGFKPIGDVFFEQVGGEYVAASDYDALKARCEALTEVVAALAKFDGRNNISHLREMARQALADGGGQ
jgi:hypothetical protein